MFKVGDKVIVSGVNGKYKGIISNINHFRKSVVKYAVYVTELDELMYVGERQIKKLSNINRSEDSQ